MTTERYDVVVIGGGQAGLVMGHHLAWQRRSFVILDASPAIGHVWRTRWDSLRLFTPARYSGLPGLPFPGDPERYPGKDEVADYLVRYARSFELPVRPGTGVSRLRPVPGAGFVLETSSGRFEAGQVVVATGPFQQPWIPSIAGDLAPRIVQIHSSAYRSPEQLPEGEVLVVGGGNSGVQIAAELARSRPVTLSIGTKLPRLPERLLGRSLFWWLERSGFMRVTVDSRLGRRASQQDALIGQRPEVLAAVSGVRLVGRVTDAEGERVRTSDGQEIRPSAILWATGYRSDYRWVDAPVFDEQGRPLHRRGVTPVPGLYFLGLPWQHTRGSALLGWVGQDAEYLAARIGEGASRDPAAAGDGRFAAALVEHPPTGRSA